MHVKLPFLKKQKASPYFVERLHVKADKTFLQSLLGRKTESEERLKFTIARSRRTWSGSGT
eukprot:6707114-Prorocentrum_lima.AAC.1